MSWFRKHKICTTILILLLVSVIVVFGFIWSKLDKIQFADEIDDLYGETEPEESKPDVLTNQDIAGLESSPSEPEIPDSEFAQKKNVVNVLLIGTDERSSRFSSNARSDSMIIASVDKNKNTVKLVSLERGMGVPILEGKYKGQYDWLTHIFRYGGADLLVKTVETCFRVDIDHYIRVNFNSVKKIVDTVGGVEIDMTGAEVAYFNARKSSENRRDFFKVGVNRLDGGEALDYARLREIDSDWKRVQRQRSVIMAIFNAVRDSDLGQLNSLADQVLPLVQTDFSKMEIAEWMLYAPKLLSASFDQLTLPASGTYGGMTGMGGRNLFAVDFEANSKILKDFLYSEKAAS